MNEEKTTVDVNLYMEALKVSIPNSRNKKGRARYYIIIGEREVHL